jgi:hypothetical protein
VSEAAVTKMVVTDFDDFLGRHGPPRPSWFCVPIRKIARLAAGEWGALATSQFPNGGFLLSGDVDRTDVMKPAGAVI